MSLFPLHRVNEPFREIIANLDLDHWSLFKLTLTLDHYLSSAGKTNLVRLRRVGIGEKDVIAVQCDLDNIIMSNFRNGRDQNCLGHPFWSSSKLREQGCLSLQVHDHQNSSGSCWIFKIMIKIAQDKDVGKTVSMPAASHSAFIHRTSSLRKIDSESIRFSIFSFSKNIQILSSSLIWLYKSISFLLFSLTCLSCQQQCVAHCSTPWGTPSGSPGPPDQGKN